MPLFQKLNTLDNKTVKYIYGFGKYSNKNLFTQKQDNILEITLVSSITQGFSYHNSSTSSHISDLPS